MAEYRDPTPISPKDPEYDKSKVSKEVANYTQQVREKRKGHDVREALARNSEIADIKAEDAVATSYDTKARQDDVENRFDDQIAGNTDIDEVIDARRPEGEEAYPTLRKRLDEEHQEVTAQLAHIEPQVAYNQLGLTGVKQDIPLMSIVDDDGSGHFLTKLLPLAQKYNIPMVSAVIVDNLLGSSGMNVEDVLDLQNNHNIEIASHSSTHANNSGSNNLSKEEQFHEVYDSMAELRKLGLTVDTFVYPYGASTPYARSLVSKYYKAGVSTDTRLNGSPVLTQRLGRYEFPRSGWTLNDYKERIDVAKASNRWIIWMTHSANMTESDVNILDQLIGYTLAENIEIVSVSEGIDIVGNYLDINEQELYIANNGKNNIRDLIFNPHDTMTGQPPHRISTPANDFEELKVNVDYLFSPDQLEGAPIDTPSYLTTTKFANDLPVMQELKSYDKVWHRRSTPSGVWQPFTEVAHIKRATVTVPSFTIGANSVLSVTVDLEGATSNNIVHLEPRAEPPAYLMWSVTKFLTGKIRIRFYNTSNTERNVSESEWVSAMF